MKNLLIIFISIVLSSFLTTIDWVLGKLGFEYLGIFATLFNYLVNYVMSTKIGESILKIKGYSKQLLAVTLVTLSTFYLCELSPQFWSKRIISKNLVEKSIQEVILPEWIKIPISQHFQQLNDNLDFFENYII